MERYVNELEIIEETYAYHKFQHMNKSNHLHCKKMEELIIKKEVYLHGLAQRQESIDQLRIDFTNCLLGSPTGYCLRNGVLEKENENKEISKQKKDTSRNNYEFHHCNNRTKSRHKKIRPQHNKLNYQTIQNIKKESPLDSISIGEPSRITTETTSAKTTTKPKVHGKTGR
ncbi:MAG: hypothetical protein QS721_03525 [Candidatus Endonucleobacter sp. (ex Gigantidas childressi)]|nr:hypothetical protein [Candidatus Endonucleobacter sp. (ex Gigantidas childressi)]